MQATIKNAMIVDDEIIDQKMYRRVINKTGIVENVISFSLAQDAFDYLADKNNSPVDVIFLDINMPRMDGFEFLDKVAAELKHDVAHVVFIMLTTSLNPKDREKAATYENVRDFINKPLEASHVLRAAKLLSELNPH